MCQKAFCIFLHLKMYYLNNMGAGWRVARVPRVISRYDHMATSQISVSHPIIRRLVFLPHKINYKSPQENTTYVNTTLSFEFSRQIISFNLSEREEVSRRGRDSGRLRCSPSPSMLCGGAKENENGHVVVEVSPWTERVRLTAQLRNSCNVALKLQLWKQHKYPRVRH